MGGGRGREWREGEEREREEEGYMPNRQNHIRITIQESACKEQNSTKKLVSSRLSAGLVQ